MPDAEFSQRTAGFQERLRDSAQDAKAELVDMRRVWEREPDATTRAQMAIGIRNQEKEVRQLEEEILEEILPEAFALR